MSKAFENVMDGLDEALAFARGEKTGAIVHEVAVPIIELAAIRARIGRTNP